MVSRMLVVLAAIMCTLAMSAGAAWAGPGVSVPEPSSLALLAVGLGAAAWVKFRGRK